MATSIKWQFSARFRRNAFGWKSQPPILRIKEALAEIKQVAKKETALAAEGAVLFLEKLAPALSGVDSSSGAIGTAVNRAIDTLVPIIAKADVSRAVRAAWLERLFQAIQDDDMPYLEHLGQFWGDLCVTPELADQWADDLASTVTTMWEHNAAGAHGFFRGTSVCLSALCAAGQIDRLLALLDIPRYKHWHDRQWGAEALFRAGRHAEAIAYAENSLGLNTPLAEIAPFCERVLLGMGDAESAYARYALKASYATTNLATFKAVAKKYPGKPPETILRDLIASTPGQEGKWFAAAKASGLFALATELAQRNSADPRTLIRAAKDYAIDQPEFALAAGTNALSGIARGAGYDITSADVRDAYAALVHAARSAGVDDATLKARVRTAIAGSDFLQSILAAQLAQSGIK